MKFISLEQAYDHARALEPRRMRSNIVDVGAPPEPHPWDPGIVLRAELTAAWAKVPGHPQHEANAAAPAVALFSWWGPDHPFGPAEPLYRGRFVSLTNDGARMPGSFNWLYIIEARFGPVGGGLNVGMGVSFVLRSDLDGLSDIRAPFTELPDGTFKALVQDKSASGVIVREFGLQLRPVTVAYVG